MPWWWSECSPSTWTIRVRIPLNSTIFLYNLYLIGTKINKKEARDGPFLNGIASPYPTLHCLLGKNLILNLKYLISKNNLKIFFPSFSFRILRIRSWRQTFGSNMWVTFLAKPRPLFLLFSRLVHFLNYQIVISFKSVNGTLGIMHQETKDGRCRYLNPLSCHISVDLASMVQLWYSLGKFKFRAVVTR